MSEKEGELYKKLIALVDEWEPPRTKEDEPLTSLEGINAGQVFAIFNEAKAEFNEALKARVNELTCEDAYDRLVKTIDKWFGEH